MDTPVDQRVAAAEAAPKGHLVPSGVSEFLKAVDGNASGFAEWRRLPMTRKVLAALQDVMIHSPSQLDVDDRLVQYGMTQGLVFAVQLVADPSAIWPGAFGKGTDGAPVPSLGPVIDFDTSIDQAIDGV